MDDKIERASADMKRFEYDAEVKCLACKGVECRFRLFKGVVSNKPSQALKFAKLSMKGMVKCSRWNSGGILHVLA